MMYWLVVGVLVVEGMLSAMLMFGFTTLVMMAMMMMAALGMMVLVAMMAFTVMNKLGVGLGCFGWRDWIL